MRAVAQAAGPPIPLVSICQPGAAPGWQGGNLRSRKQSRTGKCGAEMDVRSTQQPLPLVAAGSHEARLSNGIRGFKATMRPV